ncbi:WD40 repeat domain-containing protein [Pelotomaculum propionicicum]|uniref:WD40 repeat domain-containing protein n=1 Tax=Pelotomaculum propionicicum TaxID=258475 RepID=UPI003B81AB91
MIKTNKITLLGTLSMIIISLIVLCACNKSTGKGINKSGTALTAWTNAKLKFELDSGEGYTSIAFSPDGKTLATGSTTGLMTWDVASGKKLINFYNYSNHLAYSLDGKVLASLDICSGNKRDIKLWDVVTGNELRTLSGINWKNTFFTFSPDGKTLVSGGSNFGEIRFWDYASGQIVKKLNNINEGLLEALSPDGRILATFIYDRNVILWDAASGTKMKELNGSDYKEIYSFAFSPDWKTMAINDSNSDGNIKLYNVVSGEELKTLKGAGHSFLSALTYSPDGSVLVLGERIDNAIKILDLNSDQCKTIFNTHDTPTSVAISPDGKYLAAGDSTGYVAVWELP